MEQESLQVEQTSKYSVIIDKAALILCTVFVAFHLYTALVGDLYGFAQAGIHLGLVIPIACFRELSKLLKKGKKSVLLQILYYVIAIFALVFGIFVWRNSAQLLRDATTFTPIMGVLGAIMIVVLIVACWKFIGPAMAVLAAFFVVYALFGKYFPLIFRHGGMRPTRFLHLICFTSEGIFGSPLSASASYIAVFIALGALFNETGVGDYLCDFAKVLMGRFRGGPAKIAVISSCMFGSISGSAVANVVGTGTFTIPLMKKSGYDAEFAGATEAAASTGGALMPPVMGAAAFLLAEVVGVKYWNVVVAAIIPALFYYLAILI